MKQYNDHHTPGWKYFLRMLLGIFLSLGFLAFWCGLKTSNGLYIFLGILSLVIGILHFVISLSKSNRR